jgi:hypothetical protein
MAMEIEQPDSVDGGGQFLEKAGTYHCLVTAVDENPTTREGEPLSGLKVNLTILAGTHADQKDKTFDLMLWSPNAGDSSDMPKKKQTRFCLATCLIGQHTPGQRVTIEPSDAVGRQIVAKFASKQKKNEATGKWEDTDRLDLHFADIWHVDDDAVKSNSVPLDQSALKLIPAQLRRSGSAKLPPKSNPGTGSAVDVGDV